MRNAAAFHRRHCCRISLAVGWIVVAGFSHADTGADRQNATLADRTVLQQLLRQSSRRTRLLDAARSSLRRGELATAFDACRELLQEKYDAFTLDESDDFASGIRQGVRDLLAESSPTVRREWNRVNAGPAGQALQEALRSGSQAELHRVATRFALTQAAFRALLTECLIELSRGNMSRSTVLLQQLESYRQLGIASRRESAAVRRLQYVLNLRTSALTADSDRTIRFQPDGWQLPERMPEWSWRDSPWNHDSAANIGPWSTGKTRRFLHLGRQTPAFTDDSLVIRTPSGLVCLDRESGVLQWSLATNSLAAAWSYLFGKREQLFRGLVPEEWLRMEHSGSAVFLVDGFGPGSEFPPELARLIRDLPEQMGGRRVVAVNIGRKPRILWQTGDDHDANFAVSNDNIQTSAGFEYEIRKSANFGGPVDDTIHRTYRQGTRVVEPALEQHRFISAPLVQDDRLYIATRDPGRAWLNCLSATSGRLLWQQPLIYLVDDYRGSTKNSIVCGVLNNTLFCLASDGLIVGCGVLDGQIRWAQTVRMPDETGAGTNRAVQEPSDMIVRTGAMPGSGSLWLRITAGRIYCGRPTCPQLFCLNADTGDFIWSVPRSVQGEFAARQLDRSPITVTDNHLIMLGDAHCRALRLKDGQQDWVTPVGAHSGQPLFSAGRCLIPLDDGRILAIDANTGRVDRLHRVHPALAEATVTLDERGIVASSAWNVTAWDWTTDADPSETTAADVDSLLSELATIRRSGSPVSSDPPIRKPDAFESNHLQRLQTAVMTDRQQLLFALLAPELPGHADRIRQQLDDNPLELVELRPGWRVQLLRALRMIGLLSAVDEWTSGQSCDWMGSGDLSWEVLLHPELTGDRDSRFALADQLIDARRMPEAELLLLNLPPSDRDAAAADIDDRLLQIRRPFLRPGTGPAAETSVVSAVIQEIRRHDLTSPLVREFRASRGFAGHSGSAPEFPNWYRLLPVASLSESASQDRLLDVRHGSYIPLPDTSTVELANRVSHSSTQNRSALVINASDTSFGVSSLVAARHPVKLWTKTFDIITGPTSYALGTRFLAAVARDGIVCVHPLTGRLLWSRDFRECEELSHLPGQRLIVRCTHEHILLFSSLGTGCVVLTAEDGTLVRQSDYEPGTQQQLLIGTYLVTLSEEHKLRAVNLATGSETTPIPDGESILYIRELSVLSDTSLLLLSDTGEMLILDAATATVTCRIDVGFSSEDIEMMWRDPVVFLRHGYLFAAFSRPARRGNYSAGSVLNEPQLGNGPLYCLDTRTNRPLWRRSSHRSVVPPVYGDPCSLLVLWSWTGSNRGPRRPRLFGEDTSHRSLELTVLDIHSGRVLAHRDNLAHATPLRSLHDAQMQTIEITTDQSVIHVNYTR